MITSSMDWYDPSTCILANLSALLLLILTKKSLPSRVTYKLAVAAAYVLAVAVAYMLAGGGAVAVTFADFVSS